MTEPNPRIVPLATIRAGLAGVLLAVALFVALPADTLRAAVSVAETLKREAQKFYWGKETAQDLPRALELYERAAALGDPEASYIAGGMYYKGIGTLKDPFKAFKYLDYAARNGKTSAQSSRALAEFYILGAVVPRNYQKAFQWYREAAQSGDREAQLELGYLYFVGRGIEQDFKEAMAWFRKAALNGDPTAQYNLGIMWYTGNGVESSSLERAYGWLSLAAANQHRDAVGARDFLQTQMGEEQLERAQQVAAELYREISENR